MFKIQDTNVLTGIPPFIGATGGTITESGNFKIHTFTGPGTFTVSRVATCLANNGFLYGCRWWWRFWSCYW